MKARRSPEARQGAQNIAKPIHCNSLATCQIGRVLCHRGKRIDGGASKWQQILAGSGNCDDTEIAEGGEGMEGAGSKAEARDTGQCSVPSPASVISVLARQPHGTGPLGEEQAAAVTGNGARLRSDEDGAVGGDPLHRALGR